MMLNKANVNAQSHLGWTPLHEAVSAKKYFTAEILIAAKANTRLKTLSGKTPLDMAILQESQGLIKLLADNKKILDD
jgi:ankyrin repeat protein